MSLQIGFMFLGIKVHLGPVWHSSVDWASFPKEKAQGFDSQSGHTPGVWSWSPQGTRAREGPVQEATD